VQVCTACEAPYYHDAKPCAAVLVLDERGRLLLGRRAIEPRLGLWDIPGGFCGPDETPEACAVRELLEETGCTIELTGFLAHLMDTYGDDGDHTLNAVFTAQIVDGTPVPADDVAELRWFDLEGLPPVGELAFRNTSEAIALLHTP
jgi:ADP-ribose pyrophosphatase YjhB (NUDIX family)